MTTITIDKDVYDLLVRDHDFLNCLRNAGVDNWEGYEFAQEAYEELEE